ncbi:Nitroreductase-like protein [Aspergillus californicus]
MAIQTQTTTRNEDTITSLVEDRYKDNITFMTFPFNETPPPALQTILQHRSIRSFLPTALPRGTLEALAAAGQSASTTSMLQTWNMIAIQDHSHKGTIAKISGDQAFIHQAPLFLIFCPNLNRMTNLIRKHDQSKDRMESIDMLLVSTIDATLAGQNVAIAAEALGLGICFVGGVRNNAAELTKLLKLPDDTCPLFGMAIGYADTSIKEDIKPRLPMKEVLHYETWDDAGQEENIAVFDKVLSSHYHRYLKVGRKPWSTFVADWKADGKLDGREDMGRVLGAQGFILN